MAADAVDAAVHGLNRTVAPSCTEDVPLLGAEGYHGLWNTRRHVAESLGVTVGQVERLLGRYGSLIGELAALIAESTRAGRAAGRGAGVPEGGGASTPPRTRGRCIWTTSWPAGPGSRSRPGTVASAWRPRWPSWSRPCSAGTPPRSTARSSTTAPGSLRSGRVSTSPTTCPLTPPGWAPRTFGWAGGQPQTGVDPVGNLTRSGPSRHAALAELEDHRALDDEVHRGGDPWAMTKPITWTHSCRRWGSSAP